jgi:hypothetical protein
MPPAVAQSGWTFNGVQFDARDGWCTRHTTQGGNAAMEVRPCGSDYPYMSLGFVAQRNGQVWDVAAIVDSAVTALEGPEGPSLFAEAARAAYGECTKSSMRIERDAVPQVPGYSVIARFVCTKDGASSERDFKNFSGYALAPNGDLWIVAFDYPDGDITSGDAAMIQAAVDRITKR